MIWQQSGQDDWTDRGDRKRFLLQSKNVIRMTDSFRFRKRRLERALTVFGQKRTVGLPCRKQVFAVRRREQ